MNSFRNPVDEWLKETIGADANKMVTMLDKLTDQQYDFCRQYVLTGSPEKAALNAKLTRALNPHLLIHLPKIAVCINILTAKREAELGKKSSAEILERLYLTEVVESDDFDFSDDAVEEREAGLAANGAALKEEPDNTLIENVLNASVPANHIMQLPKVKVSPANSFGAQWVIERMVSVAERCLQIEPVYDRKGRPIGQFTFNAAQALKALEMCGKTMAMFKDKVEITTEYSALSEDEINKRIAKLLAANPGLQPIAAKSVRVPDAV